MIIPEVKSMDLQLSNGVSTNTTRQIVAEIHKFEILQFHGIFGFCVDIFINEAHARMLAELALSKNSSDSS